QNASLARADVQSWLDVEIRKAGVMEPRVTVLDPVDFNDGKPDHESKYRCAGASIPPAMDDCSSPSRGLSAGSASSG
ncbi:hypothetical protein D0N87_31935, partial [Pseudomonas sp. ATCC 13867]